MVFQILCYSFIDNFFRILHRISAFGFKIEITMNFLHASGNTLWSHIQSNASVDRYWISSTDMLSGPVPLFFILCFWLPTLTILYLCLYLLRFLCHPQCELRVSLIFLEAVRRYDRHENLKKLLQSDLSVDLQLLLGWK